MIPKKVLEEKFRKFVEEDVGQDDITTLLTIPSGTVVEAKNLVKESGVIAGIEEALMFSSPPYFRSKSVSWSYFSF